MPRKSGPATVGHRFGPCCTLLPPVQRLIEAVTLAKSHKKYREYRPVWLPDLPPGPQAMTVEHDCTKVPAHLLGTDEVPKTSAGRMKVAGVVFRMSEAPPADQPMYVSSCDVCHIVFFSRVWDDTDTVENYVKRLKGDT